MAMLGTHPMIRDLIRALGLRNVRSLTIHAEVDSAVTVSVEFLPVTEDLEPVFKRYKLSAEPVETL